MLRPVGLLIASFLSFAPVVHAQKLEFSQANAFALLKTLAQEIGPRPMGSPAEQRALQFAVAKFSEFGCQETFIMPMAVADGINTTSGIAVGVLKGETGRIIIIGGHIDSSGPEVPGANDDASGAACVMELARVLAGRRNQSTVLFCCWGGEEQGLLGSKYFVKHFSGIDSVGLMIQLDMADGAGRLEIDPDSPGGGSSPGWLTKAAYEIYYDSLGYSDLIYPVHSATLSLAAGGAYGSDHDSFLLNGIPAIDFTSDINYPIHTPQDRLENFTPSGLKRSGDLALGLFERFDKGVPPRATEQYMLFQIGDRPVFLPHWILWSGIAVAVLVSIISLWISHRRHRSSGGGVTADWSGLKLLLFTLFLQLTIRCFSLFVGMLRGYRYPWVNNSGAFALLGVFSGLLAVWVILQITRRVRMSADQFVYTRVAIPIFLIVIAGSSFLGPRLAVYPALSLLLFSLAVLTTSPVIKLVLMLASPYPVFRLVFNESLGLFQRIISQAIRDGTSGDVIYNTVYVLVFTLLSLPFVFGLSAIYVDVWKKPGRPVIWRNWKTVIGIAGALAVLILFILGRPVYDRLWYSVVRIEQQSNLASDSSRISVEGSDYLTGLRVGIDGKDTTFSDRTTFHRLALQSASRVPWCSLERLSRRVNETAEGDSLPFVERTVHVHSMIRPLRVDLAYRSDKPFEVRSSWSQGSRGRLSRESDRVKRFSWYAYPDTGLLIPVIFKMREDQLIAESIMITYDTLSYPVVATREYTNITMRTIVSAADTIRILPPSRFASNGSAQ